MPVRSRADIRNMPVMAGKCKTCPFSENGCKDLRESVISRLLEVSQTCHSTGVALNPPRQDTHLCRGARDWQIEVMHRIGVIEEPTDAAWDRKLKELEARKS